MSYSPQNVEAFAACYSGALSGMAASNRYPTDPLATDYVSVATIAGAFAQELDTQRGSGVPNSLELGLLSSLTNQFWFSRSPLASAANLAPVTHSRSCAVVLGLVQAALNYFTAQGITPPTPGGGSLAVEQDGNPIVNPAVAIDFSNPNANPWRIRDAGSGAANVAFGGYGDVFQFGGGEDVTVDYVNDTSSQLFRFSDGGTLDLSPPFRLPASIPFGFELTLQVLGSFPVSVVATATDSSLNLENPSQPGTYFDLESSGSIDFFPGKSVTWLYNPVTASFQLQCSSNYEAINTPPLESDINAQQVVLGGDGNGSRFTGSQITVFGPASSDAQSNGNVPGWVAVYAQAVNDEDRLIGVGAKNQAYVIIPRQPIVQFNSIDTQAISGDVIVTGTDTNTSTVSAPLDANTGARFTVQAGSALSSTFNTIVDFSNGGDCNGQATITLDTQYQSRTFLCINNSGLKDWIIEAEYNP